VKKSCQEGIEMEDYLLFVIKLYNLLEQAIFAKQQRLPFSEYRLVLTNQELVRIDFLLI